MKLDETPTQTALAACENEPIRIPGMVQPHGMLIVLRQSDLTILQISESVFDLIGVHPTELLHQPLSVLMDRAPVESAAKKLGDRIPRLLNPIPIVIAANGQTHEFDGILHRSGRTLILELELHVSKAIFKLGFGNFYEAIRETISSIMQASALEEVFTLVCNNVRSFTGFARVLVYKFDEDWNGIVVGESREPHIPSLMHHRFPAGDIPRQARELYTINWLRLIPNVNYKPSKMVPVDNPLTGQPLDMSNCVLRSVSPVHLEYMRNMGHSASMSISLMKGQKLWGLIACHNPDPLYLRYDVRVAAEFVGQMVSTQIMAREEASENDYRLQLKAIYDDLLARGGSFNNVLASLKGNASSLLALVDAPGAALVFDGAISLLGSTPSLDKVQELTEWLRQKNTNLYSTHTLSKEFAPAAAYLDRSSGLLAIQIPHLRPAMILWFRPELKEQIPWAGNPDLSKNVSSDGRIHPRSSFATWLQSTSGSSRKWLEDQLLGADQLRSALISLVVRDDTGQVTYDERGTFRHSMANNLAAARTGSAALVEEPTTDDSPLESHVASGELLLAGFAEVAILIVDLDGRIQNWSAGANQLLSRSSLSACEDFARLFSESDALGGKATRLLEEAQNLGRVEDEAWVYREDNSSFWAQIIVSRILNARGHFIGYTVILRDVSLEKSAEEELRATKLAAEAANVAKTNFIANISHEIRTPLGAILGFSEVMAQRSQTHEQREELYLRIKRNGDQLIALINDLLDVTKIEAGRLEVEQIEFDLQALLSDLRDTFSIKAAEKSLQFNIEIKGEIRRRIICDPTRIRQILVNLLSNAIKFTPMGGAVTLSCSVDQDLKGQHRLSCRVEDTGRGMSELEMEKLFRPFVQADISTTRKYGGTGLGLYVSQRLARALGGDLNIEFAALGKGARFLARMNIDFTESEETFSTLETFSRRLGDEHDAHRPLALKGKRVLVVDDAPDNRALVGFYLKDTGVQLDGAENGAEALEKIAAHDYDLVLMDIQMPVLDGNAAMRKLKTMGFQRPVIALTANAMQGERENSIGLGFSDYLTKPVERVLLRRALSRWLTSN